MNGIRIGSTALASTTTPMDRSTKETGSITRNMAREPIIIKTVINISEIGSKIKRMAMECSNTPPEQFMMESGSMIEPLTREKSSMQIRINIRATS